MTEIQGKQFAARLQQAMNDLEMSLTDLARQSKVDKSAISRYLRGSYLPKQVNLSRLADALHVDEGWLMTGVKQKVNKYGPTLPAGWYPFIPESISAGKLEKVEANTSLPYISVPDVCLGKYAKDRDLYFMTVNGESMNRVIPNHSLIAVKSPIDKESLNNGDIVVASSNGSYTVKRFINDKTNGRIILRPDSTDIVFSDLIFTNEEVQDLRIFGKVVIYSVVL